MKKLKLVCLGAVLSVIFALTACGGYTPKIYDNAQKWVKQEVLQDNMTQGAGSDDSALPKEIVKLIDTQEKCDETFANLSVDVDFSKEKMILYFYTSHYMKRNYDIKKMEDMGGVLYIYIEPAKSNVGTDDQTDPQQRCLLVVTDNTGAKNVNVVIEE